MSKKADKIQYTMVKIAAGLAAFYLVRMLNALAKRKGTEDYYKEKNK